MSFRVRSRSPATFKTELSVTTVNSSFQLFPIFCHKELHLRCCIGLELNIVASTKIQGVLGYQGAPPVIDYNLRKILKLTSLDALQIHFQKFFTLTHLAPAPQNGQTHPSNSSAVASELFDCVWPFCGVAA